MTDLQTDQCPEQQCPFVNSAPLPSWTVALKPRLLLRGFHWPSQMEQLRAVIPLMIFLTVNAWNRLTLFSVNLANQRVIGCYRCCTLVCIGRSITTCWQVWYVLTTVWCHHSVHCRCNQALCYHSNLMICGGWSSSRNLGGFPPIRTEVASIQSYFNFQISKNIGAKYAEK